MTLGALLFLQGFEEKSWDAADPITNILCAKQQQILSKVTDMGCYVRNGTFVVI